MSTIDIIAKLSNQASPEAQKLAQDLGKVDDKAEGANKRIGNLGATLQTGLKVGLGAATAGFGLLAAGMAVALDAARDAEVVQGQLNAVIESTGGAAGLTAEEVNKLATEQERLNAIDGDFILTGQNMLLTFTQIGEEVFPRASQTMLDMATAMTQGNVTAEALSAQAIQLGKALNAPITGVSALTKVGVTFTAEQKEMIRTMVEMGDVAGAQTVILDELAKEFGGSAAANAATLTGRIRALEIEGGRFAETVGNAMIPAITEAAENAIPGLQAAAEAATPKIEAFATWIGEVAVNASQVGNVSNWKNEIEETALAQIQAAESAERVNEALLSIQDNATGVAGAILIDDETWRNLAREVAFTSDSYEDYETALEGVAGAYRFARQEGYEMFLAEKSLADQTQILTDRQEQLEIRLLRVNEATEDNTTITFDLTAHQAALLSEVTMTTNAYEHYGEGLAAVTTVSNEYATAAGVINENLTTQAERLDAANQAFAGYYGEARTATDLTFNAAGSLLHFAEQAGANATVLALLTAATGNYDEAQIRGILTHAALTTKAQELGQALANNTTTVGEAMAELEALQEQMAQGINIPGLPDTIQQVSTLKNELLAVEGDYQVNINTNYTSSGTPNMPGAPGTSGGPAPIPQATGGDWLVTSPTLFLAGEAGPERATFTPLGGIGQSGGGGGNTYYTITIDARGAAAGVENNIVRGVNHVMKQYTRTQDGQTRMR